MFQFPKPTEKTPTEQNTANPEDAFRLGKELAERMNTSYLDMDEVRIMEKHLIKAAMHGWDGALYRIGWVYEELWICGMTRTVVQTPYMNYVNEPRAKSWYEVGQFFAKAKAWYQMGAARGEKEAAEALEKMKEYAPEAPIQRAVDQEEAEGSILEEALKIYVFMPKLTRQPQLKCWISLAMGLGLAYGGIEIYQSMGWKLDMLLEVGLSLALGYVCTVMGAFLLRMALEIIRSRRVRYAFAEVMRGAEEKPDLGWTESDFPPATRAETPANEPETGEASEEGSPVEISAVPGGSRTHEKSKFER